MCNLNVLSESIAGASDRSVDLIAVDGWADGVGDADAALGWDVLGLAGVEPTRSTLDAVARRLPVAFGLR